MAFPLDGPVYNLEYKSGPFDCLEVELDGADIQEIITEDITDRIELMPEWAKQVEEAGKEGIIHALGAGFDSALLLGIDKDKAVEIMNQTIELLKERKLY